MKEKSILRALYALSAVVLGAVVAIYNLPKAETIPPFVRNLPLLNAVINSVCTVLLIASYLCIRKGKALWHKRLNLTTFALSTVFLLSYVTFHTFGVETRYPADHPWRPFYLALLLSHIVLAALVLPLVLVAMYRGLAGQHPLHARIARWAFPIWLYVTVTGVVVYLMISPYYRF